MTDPAALLLLALFATTVALIWWRKGWRWGASAAAVLVGAVVTFLLGRPKRVPPPKVRAPDDRAADRVSRTAGDIVRQNGTAKRLENARAAEAGAEELAARVRGLK